MMLIYLYNISCRLVYTFPTNSRNRFTSLDWFCYRNINQDSELIANLKSVLHAFEIYGNNKSQALKSTAIQIQNHCTCYDFVNSCIVCATRVTYGFDFRFGLSETGCQPRLENQVYVAI